ncbi:MAG: hypothetical protein MUF52_05865 [Syntrophobacteraceae bacterium]|jgi:hypothetical protein|nr:hypothetical protein [Syntrophobacteraceae bacterium]
MDAVTYPEITVRAYVLEKLIPVRLPHDGEPMAERFGVVRTPCLILLEPRDGEIHRGVGFMAPEEFLAFVQLGLAKLSYGRGAFEAAMDLLQGLFRSHPASPSLVEAIVVRGRCRYRYTHDPRHLKEAHEQLRGEYPESEWVRRTLQYRLL